MVNQCAVEGCSNNSKFLNRWKNQWCFVCQGPRAKFANVRKCRCRCKVPYSLYQFPARKEDNATREIWMALIGPGIPDRVALWSPMANYHVCSDHFVDGMPTPENPHPTIKLGYKLIGNSSVHVKNPSAEKSDPKSCFLDKAMNYSSSDSFPIKSEPVTESCEIGPIVNKAIPAVLNSANGLLPAGAVSQTATNLGPEDAHSSYDTEIAANIKSEPMWVDASACDIDRSSINQESSTINQETATNNIKTELLPETDQVYLPTVCQQQTSTQVKPILVANVFSQIQAPGVCDNNAGAVCHQNVGLVPNQPPLNNQTGASTSPSHKEDPNRSNGHVVPKVYTRQVKGTKPNNVVMGTYCDPRNIHVTDSDLDGLIRLKDCPISYLVDTTATDQSEHFPPGSPLACLIPVMKPPPKS